MSLSDNAFMEEMCEEEEEQKMGKTEKKMGCWLLGGGWGREEVIPLLLRSNFLGSHSIEMETVSFLPLLAVVCFLKTQKPPVINQWPNCSPVADQYSEKTVNPAVKCLSCGFIIKEENKHFMPQ